jgi:spore coat protein A, manganese oxidase
MLSRRNVLALGAAAGAAAVLPLERLSSAFAKSDLPVPRFVTPLTVPRVLRPTYHSRGIEIYDLKMKQALAEIVPGHKTPIWGYNGVFPGPTIMARKNRPAIVRQRNGLVEDTVVHLHGGRVPASSDGHPVHDLIRPGGARNFFYPNRQAGTTLFYHDHAHMKEAEHTYKGLAGLYIVDDPHEYKAHLPRGRHDVPLVLTDKIFNADATLRMPDGSQDPDGHYNFAGDVFVVNGKAFPFFEVEQRTYRFRLLNAGSTDSMMQLSLEDGSTFHVVGNDGGLLPKPVAVNTLSLWPGERADVVIDFSRYSRGAKIVMKSELTLYGLADQVIRFDVNRKARGNDPLPHRLADFERLKESDATVTRDVVMKTVTSPALAMLINGQVFDPGRIDFRPKLGSTEIWNIINDDGTFEVPHDFHLHGVPFQILDRDDGQPPYPEERGWKDTVSVDFGKRARIIIRFDGYPGLFPFHCHLQWHGDIGMMAQMEVVK